MVTGSTLIEFCDELRVGGPQKAEYDVAEWNLLLAGGLPGSEDLNLDLVLDKIDEWTDKVRQATSRNFDQFLNRPHQFENSLGKFYMAVLCTTLQQECGVGYDPERKRDPGDARDSRNRFIHGITHGNGGTCASLPVLYAAVGRRLGYPLKIVQGARHLFLRWDEIDSKSPLARDRFNIEATAEGLVTPPDSYYQQHPFPHPDPDVDPRHYLRSLTRDEELAIFLCVRSIVLMDNGSFVDAIQPAAWARQLAPNDYSIKVHLELTMLFALNLLGEKPKWMDEQPVVRSDGIVWSRYWWPRPLPLEQRDVLPAAKLPQHILQRILPPDGQRLETGDLADALYARANHYADEECCQRALQTAMSQQSSAMDSYHHAVKLAKDRARLEASMMGTQPQRPPGFHQHLAHGAPRQHQHPDFPVEPAMPSHQPGFPPMPGMPHSHMPLQPYSLGFPGDFADPPGFDEFNVDDRAGIHPPSYYGMGRQEMEMVMDRQFAMTHGIFPTPQVASLFEYMGTPTRLKFRPLLIQGDSSERQAADSSPQPEQGEA